jgi:hypothetical protein
LIVSYGEKFTNVQNNPFAAEALKESISVSKLEKSNQRFQKYVDALRKYNSMIKERMTKTLDEFDNLSKKENAIQINFGQLTALSATPIGQVVGLSQAISGNFEQHQMMLDDMKKHMMN